jgi:hypothetical protein
MLIGLRCVIGRESTKQDKKRIKKEDKSGTGKKGENEMKFTTADSNGCWGP